MPYGILDKGLGHWRATRVSAWLSRMRGKVQLICLESYVLYSPMTGPMFLRVHICS